MAQKKRRSFEGRGVDLHSKDVYSLKLAHEKNLSRAARGPEAFIPDAEVSLKGDA